MKKSSNLPSYTDVLPHVSEIFGVYQHLLDWKSHRIIEPLPKGFATNRARPCDSLSNKFKGKSQFALTRKPVVSADTPGRASGITTPALKQP